MHFPPKRVLLNLLALPSLALLASAAPGIAQSDSAPYSAARFVMSESLLLPIQNENHGTPVGWILSYRNNYTGSETEDHQILSRATPPTLGASRFGTIVWEISRTRNDSCPDSTSTPCPDFVRVITVPDGFTSVPQKAWVDEGSTLNFYIVPAGIS